MVLSSHSSGEDSDGVTLLPQQGVVRFLLDLLPEQVSVPSQPSYPSLARLPAGGMFGANRRATRHRRVQAVQSGDFRSLPASDGQTSVVFRPPRTSVVFRTDFRSRRLFSSSGAFAANIDGWLWVGVFKEKE